MIDDARVVLEWMGYEPDPELPHLWYRGSYRRCIKQHPGCELALGPEWIIRKLVPALEERPFNLRSFEWKKSPYEGGGNDAVVLWTLWRSFARGTGPTFEAAMLAAAAAAIRGME